MNLIDEAEARPAATDGHALDAEGRRRLRRRRQILISPFVLVALVIIVPALRTAVQSLRKVSEPSELAESLGGNASYNQPGKQGEVYVFGLSYGPLPEVTITGADAILSEDSVAAATTLSICRAEPSAAVPIGVVVGGLSEYCSEVIPAEGADLRLFGQNDQLIAAVVPLIDGKIHMTGLDLAYDKDGGAATEHVAVDFRIESTR